MSGALLPKYLEANHPVSGATRDSFVPHAWGTKGHERTRILLSTRHNCLRGLTIALHIVRKT